MEVRRPVVCAARAASDHPAGVMKIRRITLENEDLFAFRRVQMDTNIRQKSCY